MDNLVESMTGRFPGETVGENRVILALSGGVLLAVAGFGARAGKQTTRVFINHGLLRAGEPA